MKTNSSWKRCSPREAVHCPGGSRYRRRRAVWGVIALTTALTAAPRQAAAQWVVTDPVNLVQNTFTAIRTLQMISHQVTQITHQVNQIDNQVKALQKLGAPGWREWPLFLQGLDDLMSAGEAIAYSAADLNNRLAETFPGYQLPFDLNLSAAERQQMQRTLLTMHNALRTTKGQMDRVNTGLAELRTIKTQMGTIRGHQEALEMANTLTAFVAEEITMLRQGLAVMTNIAAVQSSQEMQRQLQANAARAEVIQNTESRLRGSSNGINPSWE
jgi:type IV secretion system protein TrbJ